MTQAADTYTSLLESVACNLCGADDFEVVYPPRYDLAKAENIAETFRSSGDEILCDQLVRCRRCGFQYLNPRLRRDLILEGYSSGSDENFVSQVEARERTFTRSLKAIKRHKPGKGSVLDVGTGSGAFLGVAKKNGWNVAGCEPSRWLADWANKHYGIDVVPGTIFDMGLEDASFDVVTLWDVLEHTPDPRKVLEECGRVLKPGGLLVVNYPDISSFVARLMGRKWVFLLSVHLYYFTPRTVSRMLGEVGFDVVKRGRYWQSLNIGYIFFRMEAYVGGLARFGGRVAKALRIHNLPIPYWMGQVMVIARRKERAPETS